MSGQNVHPKRTLLVCQCGDTAHQLVIVDDGDFVYLDIVLNRDAGFWRRAWYALRYVFGAPSVYGVLDEVIVRREDAQAFRDVADALERPGYGTFGGDPA